MFRVGTHYLNNHTSETHRRDFDGYKEAMTAYAYEIVGNDSTATGRNVVAMGYDYINVSLWRIDDVSERLAIWSKVFF